VVELPRCARCRAVIEPGLNVVFRPDGRVHHAACPTILCPECSKEILPGTPIRRDGATLLHSNCWFRRFRGRAASRSAVMADAAERSAVRIAVRARIAAGTLAAEPPQRMSGGYSRGGICDACGAQIAEGKLEYEVHFPRSIARFHHDCFAAWDEERRRAPGGISGGSAVGSCALLFDVRLARGASRSRAAYEELRIAVVESWHAVEATTAFARVVRTRCAQLLETSSTRRRSAAARDLVPALG
jgi:hypothetical protein